MKFIRNIIYPIRQWVKRHKNIDFIYLVFKNTFLEFSNDGCYHMAAGIAFYIFFSLFPIILLTISILGFKLGRPEVINNINHYITQFVPTQTNFLMENVKAVAREKSKTGLLGLVGLIWAGRGMFLAMEYSINKAWGNAPTRSFFWRNLIALLLIFTIGIILAFSTALSSILAFLINIKVPILNISLSELSLIAVVNRLIVSTSLTFIIFLVLYKILPHSNLSFKDAVPGAVFSTLTLKIAEIAYIWYISNMANLAKVYGSIGSIIGILLWMYIVSAIFLLGAEFNIAYIRQTQ